MVKVDKNDLTKDKYLRYLKNNLSNLLYVRKKCLKKVVMMILTNQNIKNAQDFDVI